MGMEVLLAVDNKGKLPLHPMPDEVVLLPTAEEQPKTPEVGGDERMEEPPNNKRRNYDHYHEEDGPTHFYKGWATFAAVHQIKIGYMVTFKLLTPDTLKVIIFDEDGIEVVNKCGKHDEAFTVKE
ncbi:hypothetical protein VPH35_091250 [Triticum aestivum]